MLQLKRGWYGTLSRRGSEENRKQEYLQSHLQGMCEKRALAKPGIEDHVTNRAEKPFIGYGAPFRTKILVVEYINRVYVRGHKYVFGPTQTHFKMSLRKKMTTKHSEEYFLHQHCEKTSTNFEMASRF